MILRDSGIQVQNDARFGGPHAPSEAEIVTHVTQKFGQIRQVRHARAAHSLPACRPPTYARACARFLYPLEAAFSILKDHDHKWSSALPAMVYFDLAVPARMFKNPP